MHSAVATDCSTKTELGVEDMQKQYVGIDLGGTKIIVACADEKGNIIKKVKNDTPLGLDDGIAMIKNMVKEVSSSPASIGCACGGPLDWRSGIVSPLHQPKWRAVPLRQIMEKEFGCRFYVDVDTNVAALGEYFFGSAAAHKNFIYITLSTGMGAGKLQDGKICRGKGHPEMAHQSFALSLKNAQASFVHDNYLCECGAKHCLETYVSGNAIRRIYGKPAEQITDDNVIREIAQNFGEGLRNIAALYSPEAIIIGGGVAYGWGERLLAPAREVVSQNLKIVPVPKIKLASLGYNSALMGSIALAIHGEDVL